MWFLSSSFPLSVLPAGVQTEDRVPRRLRTAGQSRDVYALVKAKMSDRHLSQLPLLIYPEALLPSTERFWNSINTASKTLTQSLDSERMDELRKLRSQFLQDFPHLSRAARYYQQLMDENRPRQPYKQLEFIRAGPTAAGRVGHFELGARPLPPKPRHLQVVFHRGD